MRSSVQPSVAAAELRYIKLSKLQVASVDRCPRVCRHSGEQDYAATLYLFCCEADYRTLILRTGAGSESATPTISAPCLSSLNL
jgi:hypothetical protein